jgi:glutaredoxin 2
VLDVQIFPVLNSIIHSQDLKFPVKIHDLAQVIIKVQKKAIYNLVKIFARVYVFRF